MADIPQAAGAAWTFWSLIPAAAVTGVVVGASNQGFALLKDTIQRWQKDRRSATGLALELMEMLMRYAQVCEERAGFNRYDKESGSGYGRYCEMPVLPPRPEGVALLPRRIAGRLSDLGVAIDAATADIRTTSEVIDPGEAADTATREFVRVGYLALNLAADIRKHYGFGRYHTAGGYDFTSELKKRYRAGYGRPIGRAWSRFWYSLPVSRMRHRVRRSPIRRALRQVGAKIRHPLAST